MLQNAHDNILRFASGKTVLAAVSGGADSMALLHVLLSYHSKGALTVKVLTVDHGIRPQSASDAAFVEEFCRAHGVECRVRRLNVPQSASESGRGIEAEAHVLRKALYREALESGCADLVATAHHARDNAETILLHLFRGCGIKGLSGMALLGDDGVFRPFLYTEKSEIDAYVQAEKIPFVTDETNADISYDRNYIRHRVLPAVAERFPFAERSMSRTARIASESVQKGEAVAILDGAVTLDENALTAENIFEALRLLGREQDVYAADVERVQSLIGSKPCAKATLAGGITAAREYGKIVFYQAEKREAFAPVPFAQSLCAGGVSCKNAFVSLSFVPSPTFEKGALFFDADKIPRDAVWRYRQEGDRFTPFGGGDRKLKEYLIDQKIPLRLRDTLPLLCSGARVFLVAGVEIADSVRVAKDSKRIVRVEKESKAKGEDACER